jgi:hypothetical protein
MEEELLTARSGRNDVASKSEDFSLNFPVWTNHRVGEMRRNPTIFKPRSDIPSNQKRRIISDPLVFDMCLSGQAELWLPRVFDRWCSFIKQAAKSGIFRVQAP